ncbi:MAG: hypothetical protein ACI9JD_003816 [Rhodococcus sp. (in: high G+C Gram-positive bacteria)]|jgi:hypothetical protein
MISTRASKRRIATRFAVAGALAAAPIAVVAGTAQAAPASTHHEQFGRLVPYPSRPTQRPAPNRYRSPWTRRIRSPCPGKGHSSRLAPVPPSNTAILAGSNHRSTDLPWATVDSDESLATS